MLAVLAGCEPRTRYRILSTYVDGMPPYEEWLHPKPEQRRQRRPVEVRYQQPAALRPVGEQPKLPGVFVGERPAIERLRTWEEVAEALPKNAAGGPDWVAALERGVIAPVESLKPGEKVLETLELDVALQKGPMPVTFHHATHTRWLACENCHAEIFEMAAGTAEITMEDIYSGKYCGVCHGKVAFEVETGCPICHQEGGAE